MGIQPRSPAISNVGDGDDEARHADRRMGFL